MKKSKLINMKSKNIAAVIAAIILLFIACSWLTGCVSQRKAEKFYQKHPEKLAQACSEHFPVKDSSIVRDSVRFDTLFLEGEPVVLKDSFFIKGDTIVKVITKECPKVETIVKTSRHDSIIYRRDIAYEATLNYKNVSLEREVAQSETKAAAVEDALQKSNEGRSKWRKWCLITWAICGAYIGLRIFARLPFKI